MPYETGTSGPPIACNSGSYNSSSRAMTGIPGSDGLIHVTYSVDSTNTAITTPIIAAVQEWNALKGSTGVEFDPATPNTTANLPIQYGSSADTRESCAYHDAIRKIIVPPPDGGDVCTYEYETTDFYVDGVYDSSEDFVVAVVCE